MIVFLIYSSMDLFSMELEMLSLSFRRTTTSVGGS